MKNYFKVILLLITIQLCWGCQETSIQKADPLLQSVAQKGKANQLAKARSKGIDIEVPYYDSRLQFTDIDRLHAFITSDDYMDWLDYVNNEMPRLEMACGVNSDGEDFCVSCQCYLGCLFAGCTYDDGRADTFHWLP